MSSIGYKNWSYNVGLLRHYMSEATMSPLEISKKCGMWTNTVNNLLDGFTYGTKSTWQNLAKHLNLDFRFDVKKAEVVKPVMKNKNITDIKGIPIYVFNCLNKHKNTVVNKMLMKRIKNQRFVEILQEQGFDVITVQDQDGDWIVRCK